MRDNLIWVLIVFASFALAAATLVPNLTGAGVFYPLSVTPA